MPNSSTWYSSSSSCLKGFDDFYDPPKKANESKAYLFDVRIRFVHFFASSSPCKNSYSSGEILDVGRSEEEKFR